MTGVDKLLLQVLRGQSDANVLFRDLCRLMTRLGFEERVNLQHDGDVIRFARSGMSS